MLESKTKSNLIRPTAKVMDAPKYRPKPKPFVPNYVFELNKDQEKLYEKWHKQQMKKNNELPTAGERFQFSFVPTGLGTIATATDLLLDDEVDLSFMDKW